MARLAINNDTYTERQSSSSSSTSRPSSSSSAIISEINNRSNTSSDIYTNSNTISVSYLNQKVENVKRKYLTQNKVLAKSNSELMMKVNQLEEKVSQLIRENLQLRHNDRKSKIENKQKLKDVVAHLESDIYSKFRSMFDVFDQLRSKEKLGPSSINIQDLNLEQVHHQPVLTTSTENTSRIQQRDSSSSVPTSSDGQIRRSLPIGEDDESRRESISNRRRSLRRQSSLFIQLADKEIEKVDDNQTESSGNDTHIELVSQRQETQEKERDTQDNFERDLYENSTAKQVTEYVIPEEEAPEEDNLRSIQSQSQSQSLSQKSCSQRSQPSSSSQISTSSQPEFEETLDERMTKLNERSCSSGPSLEVHTETSQSSNLPTKSPKSTRSKLKKTRKTSRIHSLPKHSPFRPLPPNELETMPSSPSLPFMSSSISGNSEDNDRNNDHKNNHSNGKKNGINESDDNETQTQEEAEDPFKSTVLQYPTQRTSKKTQNSINRKSNNRIKDFKSTTGSVVSGKRAEDDELRGGYNSSDSNTENGLGGIRPTRKRKSIVYTEPSLRKKMRRESEKFVDAIIDEPLHQQKQIDVYRDIEQESKEVNEEDDMIVQSETLSPVRISNKTSRVDNNETSTKESEKKSTILANKINERERLRSSLIPSDFNGAGNLLGDSLINSSNANKKASERRKSMVMMFTKRRQSLMYSIPKGDSSDNEDKENRIK